MKNAHLYTGIGITAILVLLVFSFGYCAEDEVTITAYYPSPQGIYQTITMTPSGQPALAREGDMYYDESKHCLRVYTRLNPSAGALGWVDMCAPAGVIMMYSCTAALPPGWAWYNGRGGSTISDHYIVGAGGAYPGGSSGGFSTHHHAAVSGTYQTQAHTHTVPAITVPAMTPLMREKVAQDAACDIWWPPSGKCSDIDAARPEHIHTTVAFSTGSAGGGAGTLEGNSSEVNNEVPYYPTCFIIKQGTP